MLSSSYFLQYGKHSVCVCVKYSEFSDGQPNYNTRVLPLVDEGFSSARNDGWHYPYQQQTPVHGIVGAVLGTYFVNNSVLISLWWLILLSNFG
jgi:hypothetical protein